MTSREVVWRTIRFKKPAWLAHNFPEPYGTDLTSVGLDPSPDARPSSGVDEWGAVWENIGVSHLGQVKDFPLKSWSDLDRIKIPDIHEERRYQYLAQAREKAGDKFLLGCGLSLYERVHFLRGFENTWTDIYLEPENLGRLLDLLVEMNLVVIQRYALAGVDGYIFCDDWGLQNRLMISPEKWRQLWKPRYARIYQACHQAGLATFLHSCGYIVDILDDLIEIGLDVIHMDQQENMGLELLGKRFAVGLPFTRRLIFKRRWFTAPLRKFALTAGKWPGISAVLKEGSLQPGTLTRPELATGKRPLRLCVRSFLKSARNSTGRLSVDPGNPVSIISADQR